MGTRDWRLRSQDLELGLGPRREDCELTEPLIIDLAIIQIISAVIKG